MNHLALAAAAAVVSMLSAVVAFRAWVGLLVMEVVGERHGWTLTAVACLCLAVAVGSGGLAVGAAVSYFRGLR